jgi:hypothetical protein
VWRIIFSIFFRDFTHTIHDGLAFQTKQAWALTCKPPTHASFTIAIGIPNRISKPWPESIASDRPRRSSCTDWSPKGPWNNEFSNELKRSYSWTRSCCGMVVVVEMKMIRCCKRGADYRMALRLILQFAVCGLLLGRRL